MNNWIFRSTAVKTSVCRTRSAFFFCQLRTSGIVPVVALASTVAVLLSATPTEAGATRAHRQSSRPATGNVQNGKLVFESQGCNKCHGSEGEGLATPGQKGGVPRIAATSLARPAFIQQVRKPAGQMPPYSSQKVSDPDLADVYAFLQTLTTKPVASNTANAKEGQRLFTTYGCYECHGNLGQGSTRTGGSRLGPPQIPLSGFVSYVRQPNGEMPPYASKVVSNEELADIYSFLQSIQQPPPSKTIPLLNQ
jgi:mono/diheme cytochrome c family protein